MAIGPRSPAMPAPSTSGFDRRGRHRLHPGEEGAMRCSAGRMEDERTAFEADFLARGWQHQLIALLCVVWPLPDGGGHVHAYA